MTFHDISMFTGVCQERACSAARFIFKCQAVPSKVQDHSKTFVPDLPDSLD